MNQFMKKIDLYVSMLSLLLIVFFISLQVVCRLFNVPLSWPEEFAKFLHIWLVFILLGRVSKNGQHIKIDFFYNKLPDAIRKVAAGFIQLLSILVCIYIFVSAIQYMEQMWTVKSPAMGIPVPLYFTAIFIGVVAMGLVNVSQIAALILNHKVDKRENEKWDYL